MGIIKNLRVVYKILILVVVAALGMAAIGFMGRSTIQSSICRRLATRQALPRTMQRTRHR